MRDPLRLGNRVGLGALERSADYYARALELDPSFLPAALALAQVTLALLDTARLRPRPGMCCAASLGPAGLQSSCSPWAGWSAPRAALDSAVAHSSAISLTGGNSRRWACWSLPVTRLALGRADGEAPYYEGAARMTQRQ